jgi:hypothetical protein
LTQMVSGYFRIFARGLIFVPKYALIIARVIELIAGIILLKIFG